MKAKAFVEQHPLPVYLGVFISAVTAATTLTIHFKDSERASTVATAQADAAKQRLADDARIGQLEQSLASIPRLVGSQVRYLPVAKITISPAQARRLPANEHYFDTDRMYAAAPSDGWRYSTTTELRVIADQTGASTAEVVAEYAQVFGLDQRAARRLLTHFPVRLWRGKELHRVAGLPGIAALVPQVFVQRVPLSNLRHASTLISSPSRRGELARDPSLARLSRLYEGDAAGSMLVSELNLELAAMSTDRIQTTLDTIEKKGNVVYARIESVLGRPVIDDVRRPSYYWTRELIIVTTATDLYLVKTFLPHADYREGADSVWISRWLTQFKIVGT